MTTPDHRVPILTLLTDFGSSDHYVAAMKGVILGICPTIQMVDITHETTPFNISEAAYTLLQAWDCFPEGTVHLVVVDPGVGSARRPIAASVGTHRFVAPDNGVLGMVMARAAKIGQTCSVREITATRYFRKPLSGTFHGRDIFAPVAAHIASGLPIAEIGASIGDAFRPAFFDPARISSTSWSGTVLKVDHFGNLITNFPAESFPLTSGGFRLHAGVRDVTRYKSCYSDAPPGEVFVIAGSAGYLEISLYAGNAALELGVKAGAPLEMHL